MSNTREVERAELHKTIWRIANDLRGSVDGWDFKTYVLGMLFYRFISENLTSYLNEQERQAGSADFDYAKLSDADAEFGRAETVKEKGFYILPSELFANVRSRARHDPNLNENLSNIFADIEGSATGSDSEDDIKGLFDDLDVNSSIVLLKPYSEYYKEYEKRVGELVTGFQFGKAIVGEAAQKAFIKLFGSILRLKNILTAFDDFAGKEILTEREFQDYQSLYLNLYAEFRSTSTAEKESINDDVVFEIELIKQVEINVDYILLLVEQYLKKKGSGDDKEIRATIERAINSSPSLRNKKDLIEQFVDSVNTKAKVDAQWQTFVAAKKTEELERMIVEENLNAEAAREFIGNAFRDGGISATGTAITKILPPVSRFNKSNDHALKKQTVLDKFAAFFDRYFGLA